MNIIRHKLCATAAAAIVAAMPLNQAWAQPQPEWTAAQTRASAMMAEAVRASIDHSLAAARCDQAGMDSALATLNRLATEARLLAQTAQAAGQFSEIDPQVAQAVAQNVASMRDQAQARRANCPAPRERAMRPDPPPASVPRAQGLSTMDELRAAAGFAAEDVIERNLTLYEEAVARCDNAAMEATEAAIREQLGALAFGGLFEANRRLETYAGERMERARDIMRNVRYCPLPAPEQAPRTSPPSEEQPVEDIFDDLPDLETRGPLTIVEDTPPPPAAPPAAAPPPAAPPLPSEEEIASRLRWIGFIEDALERAETARLRGDCEGWRRELGSAESLVRDIRVEDVRENLIGRLRVAASQPCPPPGTTPLPSISLEFSGNVGQFTLAPVGVGFVSDGTTPDAAERDAVQAPARVSMAGISGRLVFPARRGRWWIGGGYAEGDARGEFDVIDLISGQKRGLVFGAPSPTGSTGLSSTAIPIAGFAETERQLIRARVGYEVDFILLRGSGGRTPWVNTIDANIGVNYRIDQFSSSVSFVTDVFNIFQERSQEVEELTISAEVGSRLTIPLSDNFALRIAGSAGAYYRSTELDSVERNVCSVCTPADRDFTIAIDEDDDGFGFHGGIGADFVVYAQPRFEIFAGGSVDYWSSLGTVRNPNSGDQVLEGITTGLRATDAWSWRARLGARLSFR